MVRLERTFWAVGHGAFYTEQFVDHNTDQYFTAVYDCGGKGIKKSVDDFLRNVKRNGNGKPCVDFLFISHFHYDHINGVQELINRANVKCIVVPQLTQKLLIEAYAYNAIQFDGTLDREDLMQITDVQRFVVRLATQRDSIEVPIVEVLPSENEINTDKVLTLGENVGLGATWNSGQPIGVRYSGEDNNKHLIWLYIPVNVQYDNTFADEIIAILKKKYSNLFAENSSVDWNQLQEVFKDTQTKKDIKKIYKEHFGSHNAYSMPVFSGPAVTTNKRVHTWCDLEIDNRTNTHLHMHCFNCESSSNCRLLSCLYMGDFETKVKSKLQNLKKSLGTYYKHTELQQVPHHFSQNNHASELYKDRLIAFGNVSSSDKSFSSEVAGDIAFRECHPIVIKEDNTTRIGYYLN